jgi:hypothetical protein
MTVRLSDTATVTHAARIEVVTLILGVLSELAGLFMGAHDVYERVRAFKRFANGLTPVGASIRFATAHAPSVTVPLPKTVEERLAALEDRLDRVPIEISAAVAESEMRTSEMVQRKLRSTEDALGARIDVFREFVLAVFGGNPWRAWLPLLLIIAGLLLQATSNALQLANR